MWPPGDAKEAGVEQAQDPVQLQGQLLPWLPRPCLAASPRALSLQALFGFDKSSI